MAESVLLPPRAAVDVALDELEREVFGGTELSSLQDGGQFAAPSGPESLSGRRNGGASQVFDKTLEGRQLDRDTMREVAESVIAAADDRYGGVVRRLRSRLRDYESRVELARVEHERRQKERRSLEDKVKQLSLQAEGLRLDLIAANKRAEAIESGGGGRQMILNLGNLLQRGGASQRSIAKASKDAAARFGMDLNSLDKRGVLGAESQTTTHQALGEKLKSNHFGILAAGRAWLHELAIDWTPLAWDVWAIGERYGRGCEHVFRLHRFLQLQSCVWLLILSPLVGPHVIELIRSMILNEMPQMCGIYRSIPCALLLGSLSNGDGHTTAMYAITFTAAATMALLMASLRWARHDFMWQAEKLESMLRPTAWSKLGLVAWDFRLNGSGTVDGRRWRQDLGARFRAQYDEDIAEECADVRGRCGCGRCCVDVLAKAFAPLLAFALIGVAPFAFVTVATVFARKVGERVTEAFGDTLWGRKLGGHGGLLPNLAVFVVNLVAFATSHLIARIGAKGPAARTTIRVWMFFLARVSAALPIVFLSFALARNGDTANEANVYLGNATVALDLGGGLNFGTVSGPLLLRDAGNYACPEDQAAANLLSLVLTELLLSLVCRPIFRYCLSGASVWVFRLFLSAGCSRLVARMRMFSRGPLAVGVPQVSDGPKGSDALGPEPDQKTGAATIQAETEKGKVHKARIEFPKPPFDMAGYAVDAIYFQLLLGATTILAPGFVLCLPMLLMFHFKWMRLVLSVMSSRPFIADVSALGAPLLQILCVANLMVGGLVSVLLSSFGKRVPSTISACGPFHAGVTLGAAIVGLGLPGFSTGVELARFINDHRGVAYFAAAVIACGTWMLLSNQARAYEDALFQLDRVSRRHVQALKGDIRRLERQNGLLRMRLQWHEKHSSIVE